VDKGGREIVGKAVRLYIILSMDNIVLSSQNSCQRCPRLVHLDEDRLGDVGLISD